MKTFLSILAIALVFTAVQAQERVKEKQAEAGDAAKGGEVKGEEPTAVKKSEVKKEELDINFRGQEQRVRNSIYTLGGRLTPPGKKPGEGC